MSEAATPTQYRPAQIILHWVTVVGLVTQIAIHEPIVRVTEAMASGTDPVAGDLPLAWLHVGVGTTVLIAVLARLYLRYRYGAPGHAPGTSPLQAKLADLMHRTLYVLLLAMVITGMVTWNGLAPLGGLHFLINVAIFFLVLAHVAAALYNQFVRKDGTMDRMKFKRS